MIGDIRNLLKTRRVKILIWTMLASFFIGIIPVALSLSGRFRADSIGTVNGQHIGVLEYRRKILEIQNIMRSIRQQYGVQADMVLKMYGLDNHPEELVLERLVGEKVMKALTDSLGARIHSDHVQSKLRDPYFVRQFLGDIIPPQAIRGGTIDVAALKYILQQRGISEDDFEELVNDALLRAFLFKLIEGGLYIPDNALKDAYIGQFLKKKYAYLSLPRSRYLSKARAKKLTNSEIEAYYKTPANKESYRIPEKRSAKVWAFTPDGFGVAVTDKELQTIYNRRKRSYVEKPAAVEVQHILLTFDDATKIKVRGEAQELLKEVQANPEKFAKVAARSSQSKDKGTKIAVKRTDKDGKFAKAAFALRKDGISPVIETAKGFEIIKLIEKKAPVYKPFASVKAELSKKLKDEKFSKVFATNAQRIISQARENPSILTKFIERRKGQASSVKDSTRSEKPQDSKIFNLRKVGDRAFYQDGSKAFIVELTAIAPSSVPPLASVQQKIEDALYTQRALELLQKDITIALADIRSGKKTLAQVAQALNGTVDITGWVTFTDQDSLKKLQQMKIKLPALAMLTTQGAITSDITDKNGYLIQVKQIDPFKEKEFQDKKSLIRFQLSRQELGGLSASFIQALREKADISLDAELTRRLARV